MAACQKCHQSAFAGNKVLDVEVRRFWFLELLMSPCRILFHNLLFQSFSLVSRIKALYAIHNHGMVFFFAALATGFRTVSCRTVIAHLACAYAFVWHLFYI
jgi:hypothetical protein